MIQPLQGQSLDQWKIAETAPKPPRVSDNLDAAIGQLRSIASRLIEAGDAIYGPAPQPAQEKSDARLTPSVMSRTRDLAEIIDHIERAVTRIATGL